MVALYIYSGLRREEALWLRDDDVDLQARLIRVQGKTDGQERWQPKTGRNRVVPISQSLLSILTRYRKPVRSAWYFPSPGGHR